MSEVSEIAALEQQKLDLKVTVERRQMAIRLGKNRDFRQLILEGFCLHDAARYVQLSQDPARPADEREDCLNMAQASGHLKRYIAVTIQMGAYAERTLPELEDALTAARSEEGAE